MKLKISLKTVVISSLASFLLVGCGGSSDATPSIPLELPVLTGTFVDTPVKGLDYETQTQHGITDNEGHFNYKAGETIEFKLGNLSLGKGTAKPLVTPYTISDDNSAQATNVALLLQNFDNNRTDGILNVTALKDYNLSEFNLSTSNSAIEGKLATLLSTASFQTLRGGSDFNLLDSSTVKSVMDNYLKANAIKYDKKFTQEFLDNNDFYVTDKEDGSQIQRFDNGQLYYAGDSYTDRTTGQFVQGAGYDGVFNIDGSGVATYTINDGIINIVYDTNFIVATKILTIEDTYIEVFQQALTGESRTVTWYTDKTTAIANMYKQVLNQTGFVYDIGANSVRTLNKNVTYATFTSSSFNVVSRNDGGTTSLPLTIVDGIFRVDWSKIGDPIDYIKVLSVNKNEILFCSASTLVAAKACTTPEVAIVLK